jgi:hypothetical protein
MAANVGGVDRLLRIILGATLLLLGLLHVLTGSLAIAAYVVGTMALVTGLFGFCPAWDMFGLNTCPARQTQPK